MTSVGIFVPAYDPDIDRLTAYLDALRETFDPAALRVELDAAGPGVADRIRDAGVTVAESAGRRGKGAAITAGFEALDTDVVAFADADGATPAGSLAEVVARVTDGDADLAVGSRRHPDATVESHQTVVRRLLGDGFAWLAGTLLAVDLHDYQCGAKALTAAAWERVREHLYEAGFAWDVELVAVGGALGCRVAEVPITWEDQPGSTVSTVRAPVGLLGALVRARHRAKRLGDSRLHAALAARGSDDRALIDRPGSHE
ncbi:glycosyltransferase [Halobacterium salinarum]|nr:glycosyltransferase [Halobacterium salinarum]